MPSENPKIKKALKDGKISQKQYDKLPDKLLLGIASKKSSKQSKPKVSDAEQKQKGTKKGEVRKTARKAFEPKKKVEAKGTKEVRHKTGKEKGKPGRPKGGSMVKVEK